MKGGIGDLKVGRRARELAERTGVSMAKVAPLQMQVRRAMTMVKSGRQSISAMADLHRCDRKTIERAPKRAGSAGGSANA